MARAVRVGVDQKSDHDFVNKHPPTPASHREEASQRTGNSMSAAASRLRLESPSAEQNESLPAEEHEHERKALERFTDTTSSASAGPVIAVDLDDVLSQTNQVVAECKHPPLQKGGKLM
jgi:hypothetical protein